jgi:hypothetical protein
MKKNLKITNKLKINLGLNRFWVLTNTGYLSKNIQQKNLKILQTIQQLFSFSGRAINFLFRYVFFQYIFQKKKKNNFFKKTSTNFEIFFFF